MLFKEIASSRLSLEDAVTDFIKLPVLVVSRKACIPGTGFLPGNLFQMRTIVSKSEFRVKSSKSHVVS